MMNFSQILNSDKTVILSKKEQATISGGTSCAYFDSQSQTVYHVDTASQAQNFLSHADDHWCCASCESATWINAGFDELY